MGIDLYFTALSPPSRMAYTTITALGLKHNLKEVNLMQGENRKPEFLAINPRGKIPTLVDGDLCMGESRAISTYLCNMYEKDSAEALYPKDPKARAKVDQLLYLSENTNEAIVEYIAIGGVLFGGAPSWNEEKLPELHKTLALYECLLSKENEFMAANHVTLADFFMASPLLLLPMTDFDDYGNYPKTVAWLEKIKGLKYFKSCNEEGIKKMADFYKSAIEKKKGKK